MYVFELVITKKHIMRLIIYRNRLFFHTIGHLSIILVNINENRSIFVQTVKLVIWHNYKLVNTTKDFKNSFNIDYCVIYASILDYLHINHNKREACNSKFHTLQKENTLSSSVCVCTCFDLLFIWNINCFLFIYSLRIKN